MAGRYAPGALLQETALSAAGGISRTPVRDALARLEQDGLLERAPRGYRVPLRTPEEIIDVYEARIVLESYAAATAALRHTALDLIGLRRVVADADATDDADALWRLDTEFHALVRAAAHNRTVGRLLSQLQAQMTVFTAHKEYSQRRSQGADATRREHGTIVEAIADHDTERARARMSEHLNRTRDEKVAALLAEQGTAAQAR
jgi:DNA-binding GntR family transcriptional regulator